MTRLRRGHGWEGWVAREGFYVRVTSHSSSETIALIRIKRRVSFRDDNVVVFVAAFRDAYNSWDLLISMMEGAVLLSKDEPRRSVRIGMRVWDFVVQIK